MNDRMPVMVESGGKKVYLQLGMIFNGHWLDSVEQEKAACEFETAVVRHAGRIQRDMLRIKRPMLPLRCKDPHFIGMEEAHRAGLMHKDMALTEDMIRETVERALRQPEQYHGEQWWFDYLNAAYFKEKYGEG